MGEAPDNQLGEAIEWADGRAASAYDLRLLNVFLHDTGSDALRYSIPVEHHMKFRALELRRAKAQIADYFDAPWLTDAVDRVIESVEAAGGGSGDDGEDAPASAAESYFRATGEWPEEQDEGEGEGARPKERDYSQSSTTMQQVPGSSDKQDADEYEERLSQLTAKGATAGLHGDITVERPHVTKALVPKEYTPVLDDLSPSTDVLDTSGMAGDSAWEVNVGNMRVFETHEEDKANLVIAVDCSLSIGHNCWGVPCERGQTPTYSEYINGGLEWAAAAILSQAARKTEVYAYSGRGSSITVQPVPVGHRVSCNEIGGGTPDHLMLEFMAGRIRGNIENTLAVFICDGGPGQWQATHQAALELYHAGMRFIYIIVGQDNYNVPYPADLVLRLVNPKDLLTLGPAIMRIKEGYVA